MDKADSTPQSIAASRDVIAWGAALVAFCLHALFAGRYDLFRDELYFIVCGQHPAFGYADQPPLVPLIAAGFYSLGHTVWLVRLPACLAASGLAWLAVRFARSLDGGTIAAIAAGLAATLAPMLMGITATLNTTVFDPLAWTFIAYLLVRAAKTEDYRLLIFAGLVAGIDLEIKYALVTWFMCLVVGLVLTPERRLFAQRKLWIGVTLAAVIAIPSLIWQALHGFPFLELAAASRAKNADSTPVAFVLNQVLVMNPLLAPLWIAGLVAPFWLARLKVLRFLSIAFIADLVFVLVSHGKDYYLAACYPVLFVSGAVFIDYIARSLWARLAAAGWAAAATAFSLWIMPMALPVLSVAGLITYMQHFPVKPQQQEKSFKGTLLPQVFADQLGWHDFVDQVGAAWLKIPADERARTAIKVDNYGEAAALDIYGKAYGLPPALSGHNQYYLWGMRGQHPTNLLVVQNNPDRLAPYCQAATVLGVTQSPNAMDYENGKAIAYCRTLKVDLATLWPQLKNYN